MMDRVAAAPVKINTDPSQESPTTPDTPLLKPSDSYTSYSTYNVRRQQSLTNVKASTLFV